MWLRSQDGKGLHNVRSIWIQSPTQKGEWILRAETHPTEPDDIWTAGKFSSEGRALEELGKIEDFIDRGMTGVYQVSQE